MNKEINIESIEKKLNEIGKAFLGQVSRKNISPHTGFRIINESPAIPHIYSDYAINLENCIREFLINEALYYLFDIFNYSPQRPNNHSKAFLLHSTESYEQAYCYELCFHSPSASRPIALVYSPQSGRKKLRYSKTYFIDWNEENQVIDRQNSDKSYQRISVRDLFNLYFQNYNLLR